VVSKTFVRYLEITPAALALASDECMDNFRDQLVTVLVKRMARDEALLAESGLPALRAVNMTSAAMELTLVDD
jgi:non-specific serine/threonine protein kinase